MTKKVRYIEVIVNDWFVTQVTSVTQFNAIFVTLKCRVLRCNSFIKHGDFQHLLFSLLSRCSAFLYGTKKRHIQSSDLKMLQRRDYCLQKIVFVASWSVGWHSVTTFLSKDTKSLNDTSARAGQWWVMLPHRPPSDSSVSSSSNSNGSWEGSATTSGNPALFQQLLIVVMLASSQA